MKRKFFCFQNLQSEVKSCEDPLKWWKVHEAQFHVVGYLVHQILGIVVSQIEVEHIFFIVGIWQGYGDADLEPEIEIN